jgi:hypothetical protein
MRMPSATLPARGFFAEYFPRLYGISRHREAVGCHRAAAKKPDAAACRLSC